MVYKLIKTDNYLLVVDDSDMVGKGYRLDITRMSVGIIDDDFLYNARKDLFKKIIAHLPLNGSPILEGVDLLPPYSRHQEDGVKEYAQSCNQLYKEWLVIGYKSGYKKALEKYKYTEEDMRKAISHAYKQARPDTEYEPFPLFHQYPTEFETEDVLTPSQIFYPNDVPYSSPKTITTAQGVQWVGKYK